MKKLLGSFLIFVLGLGGTMVYQNCGGSSLKATSSDADDGLRVEVNPLENDDDSENEGDNGSTDDDDSGNDPNNPDDPSTDFRFDLNRGDNFFFTTENPTTEVLSTSRVTVRSYYTIMETHIYEAPSITFQKDLPKQNYCENSALPHCAHQNPFVCSQFGCIEVPTPVRCHWQHRMTTANINNTFQALNEIRFLSRQVNANDPMIEGCNDPLLSFHKENSDLVVSLADRSCVPDGSYFAKETSGTGIKTVFETEINRIKNLMINDANSPEYCNNYSVFAWNTTKWSYQSQSGFVPADKSYFYNVEYENQRVSMRYKKPDNDTIFCASGVPIQPTEIETFFPKEGIKYDVFRTQAAIADVSTAEITYEDPVDGGAVWRFFLNKGSAMTNNGGAIMQPNQADAIQTMIEEVLVKEAERIGASAECPPNN